MAVAFLLLVVKLMNSQFNVDSLYLPMFSHCGSFSIGPCRLLPHTKLNGINLEMGTCPVNFSVWQPNDSHRDPPRLESRQQSCRHGFTWLSVRGLTISFTSSLLMGKFPRQVPISGLVPLILAYGSGVHYLILKEPQCWNIGRFRQLWAAKTN